LLLFLVLVLKSVFLPCSIRGSLDSVLCKVPQVSIFERAFALYDFKHRKQVFFKGKEENLVHRITPALGLRELEHKGCAADN
jgi:hypothetical protein